MGTPRLTTPTLRVVMLDGSEHVVQAINVDMVAWDRDRAKHGWPSPQDAPFVWLNYLAWHVLTKTQKLLPAMTLREFEEGAAEVSTRNPDDDAEDDAGVDPTNREAGPG
jgi:hypothetical protein